MQTSILLNGEARQVTARTISELLHEMGAPARGVAVALNGSVVRRSEQEITPVSEGDKIELIRAVQGG